MTFWYIILGVHGVLLCLVIVNALYWPPVTRRAGEKGAGSLSVLIPARNEENNIDHAIAGALESSQNLLEILVYDDHSTDHTAERIRAWQERDARIRLIPPGPLPEGWYGKPFACAALAEQARGDWLLFIDADARLQPNAADRMLMEAQQRRVTFLSCWPKLAMHGFWEKVFMPMLNFTVFTLFPAPLSLSRSQPSLGLAHGACILTERAAYERIGGHRLVRTELFEDTALARAWRAAALQSLCLDGRDAVSVRMYDSLPAIWRGFQKIVYPAFRRPSNFWLFLLFHFALFLLPFFVLAAQLALGHAALAVGTIVGMILLSRAVQAWRFKYPFWSVLLHPLAESGLIGVALVSWYRYRFGKGVSWKGRAYREDAT